MSIDWVLRPSMLGTISPPAQLSGTWIGIPVNKNGFNYASAFYCLGSVINSSGVDATFYFKVQESDSSEATGTAWTDVINGALHLGSWDFDTLTLSTSVNSFVYSDNSTERLTDGNRKQYLRIHATSVGTLGWGPKCTAGFMLYGPIDTLYSNISSYVTGTQNSDVSVK